MLLAFEIFQRARNQGIKTSFSGVHFRVSKHFQDNRHLLEKLYSITLLFGLHFF